MIRIFGTVDWTGLGSFITGVATLLAVILARFGIKRDAVKAQVTAEATHELVNGQKTELVDRIDQLETSIGASGGTVPSAPR